MLLLHSSLTWIIQLQNFREYINMNDTATELTESILTWRIQLQNLSGRVLSHEWYSYRTYWDGSLTWIIQLQNFREYINMNDTATELTESILTWRIQLQNLSGRVLSHERYSYRTYWDSSFTWIIQLQNFREYINMKNTTQNLLTVY